MSNGMAAQVYTYKYPHPAVATDCIVFSFDGQSLKVLLIERGGTPFKGMWAFPGGFLNMDETAEAGALRELREETGLRPQHIEQLQCFSAPDRDPRERVLSIAFLVLTKMAEVKGSDDAAQARWFDLNDLPLLAFDHALILRTALSRLRESVCRRPAGFELLPEKFTLEELHRLYEAILDVHLDRNNFDQKLLHLGILTPLDDGAACTARRPSRFYCLNIGKYDELKRQDLRPEFL